MSRASFMEKLLDGIEVEWKPLGEVAEIYGGLTGKSKSDFDGGTAKYITYKNIFANLAVDFETLESVKVSESENQHQVKYGDVLFTGSSETADEAGMSSVVTTSFDCPVYLNSFSFGVRFKTDVSITPGFAKYLFRSNFMRTEISKTASGVTRFNISKERFRKIPVPIPCPDNPTKSLEIQREIVRILDNFTELTAELTAELSARKKQYNYYRDQLLSFEDGEVEWKTLGEMFPFVRNGFVGTVTPHFTDAENGVRYLQGTNVQNGAITNKRVFYITKEFHEKCSRTKLKADDIVMVQSGHVGDSAVVGEALEGANCHALIVMSNGGECNSKFVNYYFQSAEGKKKLKAITTGGTVKHILASKMKAFTIPVPPLSEQIRIASILDKFDALINSITEGLPREIELRQKQYAYYRDLLLSFPKPQEVVA